MHLIAKFIFSSSVLFNYCNYAISRSHTRRSQKKKENRIGAEQKEEERNVLLNLQDGRKRSTIKIQVRRSFFFRGQENFVIKKKKKQKKKKNRYGDCRNQSIEHRASQEVSGFRGGSSALI